MKAYKGSRITLPLILNLRTNRNERSASRSGRFTSCKCRWYSLNRRLEFRTKIISLLPRNQPRILQPTAWMLKWMY